MVHLCAILIGCSAALWARAGSAMDTRTEDGVAEFKAAYEAWDASRFRTAADLFRQSSANAPATTTNFYWLGAAQFHLMLQLQSATATHTNETAAQAAADRALAALSTAVKLYENEAESHAMLGTLCGIMINGNLFRAARFGPRVAKHQEQDNVAREGLQRVNEKK